LDDISQRLISGVLRKVAWIGAVGAVFFAVAAPFSAAPSALADPKPPPRAHAYNVTLSCTTIDGLSDGLFAWVEGGMGGCGSDTFGTVSFTRGSPVSLGLSVAAKSPCKYQPNLPKAEVDAGFALQS